MGKKKPEKCKHAKVKRPEVAAAVMCKLTCSDCNGVGYWAWSEDRFVLNDTLDVRPVRTSESGRGPGEGDGVKRMMPRVDVDELDGGSDEE